MAIGAGRDATIDVPRDLADIPLLNGPNRLKIGLFATNMTEAVTIEGRLRVTWEESRRLALAAEASGLEAIISVARWKGWGGESRAAERCFESLAYAAGLGAITSSAQVLATVHVPTIHPVRLAKEAATIDHICSGRFGLNIVAGWNAQELAMFGVEQREHDERYKVADEWTTLAKQLWAAEEAFDFDGEYYHSPGAFSEPAPIQRPHPVIMSAGTSPAGREFAAKHANICFAAADTLQDAARVSAEIKALARERYQREVAVFVLTRVVCKDTDDDARRFLEHVAERTDSTALDKRAKAMMGQNRSVNAAKMLERSKNQLYREDLACVGGPERIVEKMVAIADAGIDGVAWRLLEYDDGLERFREQILPLAVDAGVRVPIPVSSGDSPAGRSLTHSPA